MRYHLLTLAASVIIAFLLIQSYLPRGQAVASQESVYERVLRTGVIRCGYRSWEPNVVKDPNTGELSGIVYDVTMEMAKRLSLKVDWVEELGATDFITALQTERIDLMCYGIWPSAPRARGVDFVAPIYFDVVQPFVQIGERRFDNNVAAINDPTVVVGVIDGSPGSAIAKVDFSNAKIAALTEMHNGADLFLELATGKVDVIFSDLYSAHRYMALHPNKIRQVLTEQPIRIYGASMAIKKNQEALKSMLFYTLEEMRYAGVIEKIIQKHEKYPGSFYRTAKPYQSAKE
jgi:ABC-type amino acid transport substrate-binding protein